MYGVQQVRKTTSASTASAMVLNAIERMESQASPRDPSSSSTTVLPGGSCGLGSSAESSAATTANTTTPSETCCPCPRSLIDDSEEGVFADHSDDNDRGGSSSSGRSTAAARRAASLTDGCGGDSPASLGVAEQAGDGAVGVDAESESETMAGPEAKFGESGESVSSPPSGVLDTGGGPAGPDKNTLEPPGGRSSSSDAPAAESVSISIGNTGDGEGEGDDGASGREGEVERCPDPARDVVGLPAVAVDNTAAAATTPSTVSGGSGRGEQDKGVTASIESRETTAGNGVTTAAAAATAADGNDMKDKGSNGGSEGERVDKHGGSAKSEGPTVGDTREGETVAAAKQQEGSGSSTPRKKRLDDGAGAPEASGDRREEDAAHLPAVAPNVTSSRVKTTLNTAAGQGGEIEAAGPGASTRTRPALHATKATTAATAASSTGERKQNGSGRTTAGGSGRSISNNHSGTAVAKPGSRSDSRARQTPYRLNPRAAPFTYNPGGFATATVTGGGRASIPGLCADGAAHPKPGSAAAVAGRKSGPSVVAQAGDSHRIPAGGGAAGGAAPQAPPGEVGASTAVAAVASGGGRADAAGTATASGGRKSRHKKKKKSRKKKEDSGSGNGHGDGKAEEGEGGEGVVDSRRAFVAAKGGVVEACSDGRSGGAVVCNDRPPMPCPAGVDRAGAGAGIGTASAGAGAAAERPSSLEGDAQRRGADAAAGVDRDVGPAAVVSGRKGKDIGGTEADGATGMETERPTNLPVSK